MRWIKTQSGRYLNPKWILNIYKIAGPSAVDIWAIVTNGAYNEGELLGTYENIETAEIELVAFIKQTETEK